MLERMLTTENVKEFENYLIKEEKSMATVEKYLRDVRAFFVFAREQEMSKKLTIEYKKHLESKQYAVRSINSMLASINSFLHFMNWDDCRVKAIKLQRQIYCAEDKELTKSEYLRLLKASDSQPKLKLIMQTICGTGIRVSELKYFTVEAVRSGEVNVYCKSKMRTILIPGKLRKRLLVYSKRNGIISGTIFI